MGNELQDLLRIIKQQAKIIIGITLVSIIFAAVLSLTVITPQYEARTTLLVQSHNTGNQISYNDLAANQKLVFTYGEIIKSNRIARDVISRLDLNMTEQELLKKVRVLRSSESLVTTILVKDANLSMAVTLANNLAHVFKDNLPLVMKVENVTVLDEARIEDNPEPVSPRVMFNIAITAILSLSVGCVVALVVELLDKTVKTENMAAELLEIPVLSTIPLETEKGRTGQICLEQPKSQVAEAFRAFRTNIRYMGLKKELSVVLITSALPGEGKSFITSNLGAVIAKEKKKVLLVDCDLRKPSLHKIFDIDNEYGLTSVLMKEAAVGSVLRNVQQYLDILTSGPIPPNPAEMLGTIQMSQLVNSLKNNYDIVLLDSSPIIPVTDGQLLAKISDGVVMVIKAGYTPREDIKSAMENLKLVGANIIGTVLNYRKVEKRKYYY